MTNIALDDLTIAFKGQVRPSGLYMALGAYNAIWQGDSLDRLQKMHKTQQRVVNMNCLR